jgi:two-component system chemotaxis response regulator CheY
MNQHILVVDDSNLIRTLVGDALRAAGYEVSTAEDGTAALASVDGSRFDLMLVDLHMPGIDGISFVREARTRPNADGVPILMVSSESCRCRVDQAREAGANGWMVKPFDAARLVATVGGVLRDAAHAPDRGGARSPVVEDQVQRRRLVPHRAQEARHLPPVVRAVVHQVQQDLPQRLLVGIPAQVLERHRRRHFRLAHPANQVEPPFVQRRPLGAQHLQRVVRRVDERRSGIARHARVPEPVGGVDMHQRPQHALVGRAEVAGQLLLRQRRRRVHQQSAGPGGVLEVLGVDRHR